MLHEPALGPLAPGVHALITGLAHASGAAASDAAGADIIASTLAGPATWGALGTAGRMEARLHAEVACAEVPRFAEFAPSPAELAAPARGARRSWRRSARAAAPSGARRRACSCASGGAVAARVPDAGNLAHLDNPVALAEPCARRPPPAKEER